MASKVEYQTLDRVVDGDGSPGEQETPPYDNTSYQPHGLDPPLGSTADALLRFRHPLRYYLAIMAFYAAVAIAMIAWSFTGEELDSRLSGRRVFRTGSNIPVDQLYSGLALSAILAPAGMLAQWIMHDFRQLHLFALASRKPVRVADLNKIGDDSSIFTLRVLFRYSCWYGVMQTALVVVRTALVPVGTLILTTGTLSSSVPGVGVVGLPVLEPTTPGIRRLASAMGWQGNGTFAPTLDDDDTFLSQVVYTFVGNIVSQSALVDVGSGVIGPVPTHNVTFTPNTTYTGLVMFEWDAHCEAAADIGYTSATVDGVTTYAFGFADGANLTIQLDGDVSGSQSTRLWNSEPGAAINGLPTAGTTYFVSATRAVVNAAAAAELAADASVTRTPEGDWLSRARCTPELTWAVGACVFNGTAMTACRAAPGTNTTAPDAEALGALGRYMSAVPWRISRERLAIVDKTLDALYSIPTARDWAHFFGNVALATAGIATAGYFGTAAVPAVRVVSEPVYVVRLHVLFVVLAMLLVVVALGVADVAFARARRLPFRQASFLAVANAVRGAWWDRELRGSCVAGEAGMETHSDARVMFGADARDQAHVGLAPEVVPIRKGVTYYGVGVDARRYYGGGGWYLKL